MLLHIFEAWGITALALLIFVLDPRLLKPEEALGMAIFWPLILLLFLMRLLIRVVMATVEISKRIFE